MGLLAGFADRRELRNAERLVASGRAKSIGKSVSLRSRFPEISAKIARRVSTEMRHTANLIAEDAASRINPGPDPIHLAEEIHVEREAPATYRVVAGGGGAYYGHILEHGSVHAAPRPFLIPALDAQREGAVRRTTAILRGL